MVKKTTSIPGKPPIYVDILESVLPTQNGPLLVEELINQILQIHPSTAKNHRRTVQNGIQWGEGRKFIYLDRDRILPLRLAFLGACYPIRHTREEANQEALPL